MIEVKVTNTFSDEHGISWSRLTCREGTSWCIETSYLAHIIQKKDSKLFSPYLGLPVELVARFTPIGNDLNEQDEPKSSGKIPSYLNTQTSLCN